MNPLAAIAAVLAALGGLIAGVWWLQRRGSVAPETARKLVHSGMGVACLPFPWMFSENWPVWTLAGLAIAALVILRSARRLRAGIGGVLHKVDRASWGEIYFPIAVATVFTLANGVALLYVIPVALLAFADAAGALVGKRLGKHRFDTLEGTKSVEGSLAVGIVAAACVIVPLLLSGRDLQAALLIGGVMGLFALLLEAIAWRGLDNVFLPLAAFAQISVYVAAAPPALAIRLALLSALTTLALVWRRGRVMDDSARLGAVLALYFFWVVGGWPWLIAPVLLLLCYVRFMPQRSEELPRHDLLAVICVSSAGLIWAVAQAAAPDARWFWLFTLAIATHHAVIGVVRYAKARPALPPWSWWVRGALTALAIQGTAFWMVAGRHILRTETFFAGLGAVALGVGLFMLWERELQMPADLNRRWLKQGSVAFAVSAAALFF